MSYAPGATPKCRMNRTQSNKIISDQVIKSSRYATGIMAGMMHTHSKAAARGRILCRKLPRWKFVYRTTLSLGRATLRVNNELALCRSPSCYCFQLCRNTNCALILRTYDYIQLTFIYHGQFASGNLKR